MELKRRFYIRLKTILNKHGIVGAFRTSYLNFALELSRGKPMTYLFDKYVRKRKLDPVVLLEIYDAYRRLVL